MKFLVDCFNLGSFILVGLNTISLGHHSVAIPLSQIISAWWLSHRSEKYESQLGNMSSPVGIIIPNIWKKKMFETTDQIYSTVPIIPWILPTSQDGQPCPWKIWSRRSCGLCETQRRNLWAVYIWDVPKIDSC